MKFLLLISALFFTSFWACNSMLNGDQKELVIAKVGGKKLMLSDLEMAIPANMVEIDSISFTQKYIEKWVKNQLLLQKAELNIDSKTQNEIEVMIDNYRTSLMLFKYQQMIIQQKLDTIVTEDQLETYYSKHAGNFKLDSSVVKSVFIQVPKSLHDRYKINSWLRSTSEEDLITLEDYCYQNAKNFNLEMDWKYFGTVLDMIPKKINNPDAFLKSNTTIETTDSVFAYYVAIFEYKLTNDTTPIVFVKNKIRDIIINNRKVKLIEDLENNIYNDAVDQKKFVIHTH